MSLTTSVKILDATSGNSQEFFDNLLNSSLQDVKSNLTYRLAIVGTPLANIKAFLSGGYYNMADKTISITIKVSCTNWNGATVKLQSKTSNAEDVFSDTNDIFTKDEAIDKLINLSYQNIF